MLLCFLFGFGNSARMLAFSTAGDVVEPKYIGTPAAIGGFAQVFANIRRRIERCCHIEAIGINECANVFLFVHSEVTDEIDVPTLSLVDDLSHLRGRQQPRSLLWLGV